MADQKVQVLTQEDFTIIKAIQSGMKREHILKKYKIDTKKFDSLNSKEALTELQIDKAISKLSSNQSLLDAAEAQGLNFMEELHGLKRLDESMQKLGNKIVDKLMILLDSDNINSMEIQMIVQSFVMLRKSMFSTDVHLTQNNFTSMSSITNTRA